MTFSPAQLRQRRRRLLLLLRILFTGQLVFTVGFFSLLVFLRQELLSVPVLLTGLGVGVLLMGWGLFRLLPSLRMLYLPLLLGLNMVHITLLIWSRPADELARGTLWALAWIPLLLVAGRWWGYVGALPLLLAVLVSDAIVLFYHLRFGEAIQVFIFQAIVFSLCAFITSLAEGRLRRELALREALLLSEERVSLANRLHKELAVQVGRLQSLLAHAASKRSSAEGLGEALSLAQELQVALQRSLRGVRPTPLGVRTLPEALAREIEALSDELGVECCFRYSGHLPELSPAAAEYLFRATQEALANVRVYAAAHTVTVDLDHDHDTIILRIVDDGVGFDLSTLQASQDGPWGLLGLRSQVEVLGGTLHLDSQPGAGTNVEVRLPFVRW